MDFKEYGEWAKKAADWTVDYHETLRDRPVRAPLTPGATAAQLPDSPPESAEAMEDIFGDFERIVPDGMTHWQHPRFLAYFPSNAAPASMLAEQLANAMSSNLLIWQASPAGTEMETRMVDWLRQAIGLPEGFKGLIQDAASTATLCAALTMRERSMDWRGIRSGVAGETAPRIYASAQTHSSVDKAIWVSGIGQDNLVKIPTDENFAMRPDALRAAIKADREAGLNPAGIMVCVGGTSIGAIDPVAEVLAIAKEEDLYTHVDAAWAGSAMICPEFRELWAGVEGADSIVFNPHKWLGAQFDCSIQFLRDAQPQLNTLKIEPEYLKTTGEVVTNYSEWTIPLGRRFRALKIWFLIRSYGLDGLRERIRNHVMWAAELCEEIRKLDGFEIATDPILSLFSFRCPGSDDDQQRLVDALNDDGRIYLTQGSFDGRKIIRFQVGQFDTTRDDVMMAHGVIQEVWENIQ